MGNAGETHKTTESPDVDVQQMLKWLQELECKECANGVQGDFGYDFPCESCGGTTKRFRALWIKEESRPYRQARLRKRLSYELSLGQLLFMLMEYGFVMRTIPDAKEEAEIIQITCYGTSLIADTPEGLKYAVLMHLYRIVVEDMKDATNR